MAWTRILLVVTVALVLLPLALSVSESEARAATTLSRNQKAAVSFYITNRPSECTHPENFTATASQPYPSDCSFYVPDVHLKAVFLVNVDEMTRLDVPGTFGFYQNESLGWKANSTTSRPAVNAYLQIDINGQSFKTSRKIYTNGDFTVGAWSAYIRINKGAVTAIGWDESCTECSGSQCISNDCGIAAADCAKSNSACDMKAYLGWVGTDNSGWTCVSVGELPTKLRVFSLGQVYKQAAGLPSGDFIF